MNSNSSNSNKLQQRPPKLAQRFLKWFLRDDLAEEVQGDLEEQFYKNLKEDTLHRGRLKYWFQGLNYLRPFAIKGLMLSHKSNYSMIRNYFTVAWRNLTRQKL